MEDKKLYVHFNYNMGESIYGRYSSHFIDESTFDEVVREKLDGVKYKLVGDTIVNEEGEVLLRGKDKMEAKTGRIDWDEPYDTDVVMAVDEIDDEDFNVLSLCYEAIIEAEGSKYGYCEWEMSDELKEYIRKIREEEDGES
jgi:hypothetical protein